MTGRTATIRIIPGLNPGSFLYLITYVENGQNAGRSVVRADQIGSWKADLVSNGWTIDDLTVQGGEA
ncbi:hypothetical protein [Streptosporangium jomthongense]|uniref:Uncharacterized protein n=1 Tax=Streptosporangium jomthongense TaxID=1193683 RepID=A0ABV8F419_9ACTN